MSLLLSVKSLFRSPTKTVVTFLLFFATSLAFVSRGAEYAATVYEINKAETGYSAVGTVQRSVDSYYNYMHEILGEWANVYEGGAYVDRQDRAIAPLTDEVIELLMNSEYIDFGEAFYVAGGLTGESLRNVTEQPLTEVPGYSEWRWNINEGTFEMDVGLIEATETLSGVPSNAKGAIVDKVIIGDDPTFFRKDMRNYIYNDRHRDTITVPADDINYLLYEREDGHRYLLLITAQSDPPTSQFYLWKQYVSYVDYPMIDLTALEEDYGITDWRVALEAPEAYGLTKYVNHFGLPQIPTLEYADNLYRNFHTQELVHVPDMDSIHKYHSGQMFISEGRVITSEDTNFVCVISGEYAEQNGLSVGDTIEFELSADTMTHSGRVFGRQPVYPYVNYSNSGVYGLHGYEYVAEFSPLACEQSLTDLGLDVAKQTYEIVGIWSDSGFDLENPYTYSVNTVFVPESTYPWVDEVAPRLMPSNFSFTLKHPNDMALIEEELGEQLAELGFELIINDEGYATAKPSLDFMQLSALIGFIGMSLALILSLLLITYLFIIRKKHDYAIMRALGTTRGRANFTLLISLFILALSAVLCGSLLAFLATRGFAADLSAQISEITGKDTTASLPLWLFVAFGGGVLALLLLIAQIGLVKISRTPPLHLLQGGK